MTSRFGSQHVQDINVDRICYLCGLKVVRKNITVEIGLFIRLLLLHPSQDAGGGLRQK